MAAGAGARPAPRWLKALTEPLSAAQLRRLEEHRYTAAGVSLLEPPLQLYWTWLLQWIPLWMAPNSITLLGLAINMLTTLVLISYCPTVTEEGEKDSVERSFPGGTVVKNPAASAEDARDMDSIPGLERSPGGGHGNPCQYSCLENPTGRGTWRATFHGMAKELDMA